MGQIHPKPYACKQEATAQGLPPCPLTTPNHQELPETTGNYRLWRFFLLDGALWQTPQPNRATDRTTMKYRKLPEITGSGDFSDSIERPGRPHSQTAQPTGPPRTTGNYRKLPALAIFPTRSSAPADPTAKPRNRQNYHELPETTGNYRDMGFLPGSAPRCLQSDPRPVRIYATPRTTGIGRLPNRGPNSDSIVSGI